MATNQTSIILTAQDKTRAAFESAKRNLDGLTGSLTKVSGLMAGLGVGVSVAGLTAFVKSSIDAADHMNDLAIRTGTSVEALASLELAAKQSGTDIDALSEGMGKLSVFMGKNAEQARALGITAKDPAQAFAQLADALERTESPAQRNAIAAQVLGKSYRDLLPLLAQGGDEIRRQAADSAPYADSMGRLAVEADKFKDAMAALAHRASSVGVAVANTLLPAMNRVLERWDEAIRLNQRGYGFFDLILGGVNPTGGVVNQLASVNDQLYAVNIQLKDIKSNPVQAAIAGLDEKTLTATKTRLEGLRKTLINMQRDAAQAAAGAAVKKARGDALRLEDVTGTGGNKSSKSAKQALDVIDPFGKERAASEKARADELRRFVEAQQEDVNDLSRALYEDGVRAAQEYESALSGLISNTTLAKTEQFRANIDLMNRAFFEGRIGADQYDEAMAMLTTSTEKLGDQAKETKGIADELGLTFSSAFEDAIVSGKGLSDILKGVYQDMLKITVRRTVTEPLAAGFSGLLSGFNFGSLIPSFAVGTPYVPRDMVAQIHKGEAIVPAKYNQPGMGGITVQINVSGVRDEGGLRLSASQVAMSAANAVQQARRIS